MSTYRCTAAFAFTAALLGCGAESELPLIDINVGSVAGVPTEIVFESELVAVGADASQTLTFTNGGSEPLRMNVELVYAPPVGADDASDEPALSLGSLWNGSHEYLIWESTDLPYQRQRSEDFTLATGEPTELVLTYHRYSDGLAREATLRITNLSNPEAQTLTIAVRATIPVPALDVSLSTINFGSLAPDEPDERSVTVFNRSDRSVSMSDVDITGDPAFTVSVAEGANGSVPEPTVSD